MSSEFRRDALKIFKCLHRTRRSVFEGDTFALDATRDKLNEEFRKNKHLKNEGVIKKMLKFAEEVDLLLRTTVVQAKLVEPGKYQAKITEDTVKMNNNSFREVPEKQLLTPNSISTKYEDRKD
uniref:Complex III assembly factor LYRM7 n=1 Tax=Cuerna arida TaxID=1464854 RepID=A0A1B6FGY2_9HEMI